jgi:transcriptional regulator with XRE-family HTH domain
MTDRKDGAVAAAIALKVYEARDAAGMSSSQLADASGVSRAMIGKIERCEVKPTAALLARLAPALGMTLSDLVAYGDGDSRLLRRPDQPVWIDPETGYERRAVSPVAGRPLQLVEVRLPAGVEVAMEPESYQLIHQQIWVTKGILTFREGEAEFELSAGDCLQLGPPERCVFRNDTKTDCRYVVALTFRSR